MPYETDNPPDAIKGLPKHGQEIWIAAYNNAEKSYDPNTAKAESKEAHCASVAWAAVKKAGYVKKKDKWVRQEAIMDLKAQLLERKKKIDTLILEAGKRHARVDLDRLKRIQSLVNDLLAGVDLDDKEKTESLRRTLYEALSKEQSYEAIRDKLRAALGTTSTFGEDPYPELVFPSSLVVHSWKDNKLYSADYEITEDGVNFSNIQEVEIQYVPVTASEQAIKAADAVLEAEEESEREKEKEAQEARAKKHDIGVKEGGNVTKPSDYEGLSDAEFADPVNYRYPIDKEHISAARSYYGQKGNQTKGGYNDAEWKKIGDRIDAAAKKFKIGPYAKKTEQRQGEPRIVIEHRVVSAPLQIVTEKKEELPKGFLMKVKGKAATGDKPTDNRREYAAEGLTKVVEKKGAQIREGKAVALVDHPLTDDEKIRPIRLGDIGLKVTDLFMEGNDVYFEAGVVGTQKGKDLAALVEAGIPVDVSTRIPVVASEYVKRDGVRIERITEMGDFDFDVVYGGALDSAGIQERLEQKRKEEEMELEEILEQLKQVNQRLETLEQKKGGDEAFTTEEITAMRTLKAELETKKRVKDVLESEELRDELKDHHFTEWQPVFERQLQNAKTPAEVDLMVPVVKATFLETFGLKPEPAGAGVVTVQELGPFGEKGRPSSAQEAMGWMTDGLQGGPSEVGSQRWIFERLIRNYISFVTKEKVQDPRLETKRNPVRMLCEAAGDTEIYTGDIDASAVAILPIFRGVYERLLAFELCSVQPIDRPAAKAFFLDSIYEEAADEKTSAAVKSTYADKAELSEAALLTLITKAHDITMDTPKKLKAVWSVEAEQDILAYHKIQLESEMIKQLQEEISREINVVILSDMLTGSSPSVSDNKATAGNQNFDTTPDSGWTVKDWWSIKLGWTHDDVCGLIAADKFVEPNFIVGNRTAIGYLKRTGRIDIGSAGESDIEVGIKRAGTIDGAIKAYMATAITAGKLLYGYKGSQWLRTGYVFLPYVLFYVGNLVEGTDLTKKRAIMSRYAKQKVIGGLYATMTFV